MALLRFLLIGLLPLVHVASGWYINDDCNEDQKTFLRQALNHAFQLNNYAMSAEVVPSPSQGQLLEWLFGTDQLTRQRLRASLNGISNVNTEHASADELGRDDFHIYCSTSRFKLTTHKGLPKWYDPDMEENWRFHTQFNCAVASAYTVVPKNVDKPSAIQICPWFLDYAMSKDEQFENAFEPGVLSKLAVSLRQFVASTKYIDIDFVGLFDKVISLTRAGGSTKDIGGFDGYGWKNCRGLSTTVTDATGGTDGPERNADSIALFGSACRMLNDGATINEDGTFTEAAARRLKRAIAALRAHPFF